jgi:hypothetical protein
MQPMVKKLLKLGFKEEPPYDELADLIVNQIIKELEFGPDLNPILHQFEWQHTIQ